MGDKEKPVNTQEFLTRVIDDGIEAATRDYDGENHRQKREGSIAGFEACRGLEPNSLRELLRRASEQTSNARVFDRQKYWWYRCFELEVEWVCNVVSAALMNSGEPVIITPTARGIIQAAKILGVVGQKS